MTDVNPFVEVRYLEDARDRLTDQFRDKVVIDKYLQLLISQQESIQAVAKDLKQLRSIDTATGKQLDILGDIVGQPRELLDTSLISYFAFDGYPDAKSFGDLNSSEVGGYFYSLDAPLTGNTLLNDDQYRIFIKARILKNITLATPEELLKFISFVFGAELSNVIAEGNAEFTLLIGKKLNSFERNLLNYITSSGDSFIPKPIGVKMNFGQFPSENYFGFQGTPNVKGFGDINVPPVGGEFASLI